LNSEDKSDVLTDVAAEHFYAFAFAQYQNGDLMLAHDAFHVLCARRPFEARFWFGLGAVLQEKKDYQAAMRAWAMAALLDRENPYPHFHAAECACSVQNLEDARLALREAEVRMPDGHSLKERIPLLREAWNL